MSSPILQVPISLPARDAHLVGHKVPKSVECEDAEQSDHKVIQPLLVLTCHLQTQGMNHHIT